MAKLMTRSGRLACRARALMLACALSGALAGAAVVTSHATAYYSFCSQNYLSGAHCEGSATHLTGTLAYADHSGCAGAYQNGQLYAHYVCQGTLSEHCYGNEVLQPSIENNSIYYSYMSGDVYHDGETCP